MNRINGRNITLILFFILFFEEYYTESGKKERQEMRERGLLAVMEEQHRQRNRGTCDDERISLVYQHAVGCCQAQANMNGIRDEIEAFKIFNQQEVAVVEDPPLKEKILEGDEHSCSLSTRRSSSFSDTDHSTTGTASSTCAQPENTIQPTKNEQPFTELIIAQLAFQVDAR